VVNFNDEQEAVSLTSDEWDTIYEHLYGGFEDIEDDEEESSDGDDEYADLPTTKNGYAKDGFVVDDDEDLSDEYETEDDDDDEVQYKKPVKKQIRRSQLWLKRRRRVRVMIKRKRVPKT